MAMKAARGGWCFQLQHTLRLPSVAFSLDQVPEDRREEAIKVKEQSILKLGSVLAKHGFAEGEHGHPTLQPDTHKRAEAGQIFLRYSVLATQCWDSLGHEIPVYRYVLIQGVALIPARLLMLVFFWSHNVWPKSWVRAWEWGYTDPWGG